MVSAEQIDELAAALVRTELGSKCACGVLRTAAPAFHRRSTHHDCVHHPRSRCGFCRSVDRLIGGVEARLYVEAEYGPFVVL